MRLIYTAIIASAFFFIFSIDASAQKVNRSQNTQSSASVNRGPISSVAVDPSDPSGNTVLRGRVVRDHSDRTAYRLPTIGIQGMMGQQQSTFTSISNAVQGNYIGTNVSLLNNKNPDIFTTGLQSRSSQISMGGTAIAPQGHVSTRSGGRRR